MMVSFELSQPVYSMSAPSVLSEPQLRQFYRNLCVIARHHTCAEAADIMGMDVPQLLEMLESAAELGLRAPQFCPEEEPVPEKKEEEQPRPRRIIVPSAIKPKPPPPPQTLEVRSVPRQKIEILLPDSLLNACGYSLGDQLQVKVEDERIVISALCD
jgi:hypothetical protein